MQMCCNHHLLDVLDGGHICVQNSSCQSKEEMKERIRFGSAVRKLHYCLFAFVLFQFDKA